MPEGPELHLSSQFINAVCKGRIFTGKIRRNPIHKCADVAWDAAAYTISAVSRGKELKVFLQSLKIEKDEKPPSENNTIDSKNAAGSDRLHLLFNFGMSGKFEFTSAAAMPKHAHLSFFTNTDPSMALSFVDYRRFGKWQVGADWSADRGPCVLFEYPQFRSHVLNNLSDSAFNKPVCEALLNQKYFNGIGNYLRAEICYRGGVRPFDQARAVFSALPDCPEDVKVKIEDDLKTSTKTKVKVAGQDILELCNTIALEVVGLGTSLYLPEDDHSDMSKFSKWLQCYYKPEMKNVADHNKRTMWYHGDPGPMLPKESGSRKRHAVYDKKLTKGGKKTKKESNDGIKAEHTDDTTTNSKSPKTSRKEKETSTTKHKRTTRAALKTVTDKPTKKSSKKIKSQNNQKTVDTEKCTPEKKSSEKKGRATKKKGKQQPKEENGPRKTDEKCTEIGVQKRATRARVKRAVMDDDARAEPISKKPRK